MINVIDKTDKDGKISWNLNKETAEAEDFYHKIGTKHEGEWANFAMHEQKLRKQVLKQNDLNLPNDK